MLTVPYMSPQQFVDTFGVTVDTSEYVPQGTSPDASRPLTALLRVASSMADQWCKQLLRATIDSDTISLYPTKQQTLRIWPKYRPVVLLLSLQYQYGTSGWMNVDLSNGLTLFPNYFEYGGQSFNQFNKVTVKYTYVNGFPISTLRGAVAQGATSITLNDATGVVPGDTLTIVDGADSEDIVVGDVNGNVISCPPLQYSHSDGVVVSGIPDAIAHATGIIAANIIERGVNTAVLEKDTDFEQQYAADSVITADAQTLLRPYQINR